MTAAILRGLYAITPTELCLNPTELLSACEQLLRNGARLVQYRDKSQDRARRLSSAKALRDLCEKYAAQLIINDDVDLASEAKAHGVHIGIKDCPLPEARTILGVDAIIGVTCANSLSRALRARDGGADYVAFGAFHSSRTKPDAKTATPELLSTARAQLALPICVIGGLDAERAKPLIALGADLVAVSEAVFSSGDRADAARSIAKHFAQSGEV